MNPFSTSTAIDSKVAEQKERIISGNPPHSSWNQSTGSDLDDSQLQHNFFSEFPMFTAIAPPSLLSECKKSNSGPNRNSYHQNELINPSSASNVHQTTFKPYPSRGAFLTSLLNENFHSLSSEFSEPTKEDLTQTTDPARFQNPTEIQNSFRNLASDQRSNANEIPKFKTDLATEISNNAELYDNVAFPALNDYSPPKRTFGSMQRTVQDLFGASSKQPYSPIVKDSDISWPESVGIESKTEFENVLLEFSVDSVQNSVLGTYVEIPNWVQGFKPAALSPCSDSNVYVKHIQESTRIQPKKARKLKKSPRGGSKYSAEIEPIRAFKKKANKGNGLEISETKSKQYTTKSGKIKKVPYARLYGRTRELKRNPDGTLPSDVLECPQCKALFGDETSLSKHLPKHEEKLGVKCDFCPQLLRSKTNKERHEFNCHVQKGDIPFKYCQFCVAPFSSKLSLTLHMKDVHGFKPEENGKGEDITQYRLVYICNVCDAHSTEKNNLERHIKADHLKIKEFQCPECEGMFSTKNNLNVHIRSSHCGKAT